MSFSVIRAIGTRSLRSSISRVSAMCFVSENSRPCLFKVNRMMSVQTNAKDDPSLKKKSYGPREGYTPVYRLPSAGKLAFINSSKRNQMRVLAIVAPISIALSYVEILPWGISSVVCLTGTVIALKLELLGMLAKNIIGFVYLSPDKATVQISYIDEKGSRQEAFLPVSDIMPLSESPRHMLEGGYSKIFTYSNKLHVPYYKLSLRYGEVLDKKLFSHIFGHMF